MKQRLPALFIAALLLLFGVLIVTKRPATYYPLIDIEVQYAEPAASAEPAVPPAPLKIGFLFNARSTLQSCEALTGNVARITLATCAKCVVRRLLCAQTLNLRQQTLLSEQPLDTPSGRMATGVVTYSAVNPDVALAACQQAQNQSAKGLQPVTCYDSNAVRPRPAHKSIDLAHISYSLLALLAAAVGSWFVNWLIVKYEHLHAHFSHDHTNTGPQKFHSVPTPRIGGIGLVFGLIAAGGVMMLVGKFPHEREFGLLLIAGIPAFLGGLVEDITKKVGVIERLLLTMLSGAIAAWLLGAVLNRLDIPGVDQVMLWLPLAVTFTVFAVGGIANSINIIDGYNGLAGGYAVIVLIAIAWVAAQVGDTLVFPAALATIGALLGFLKWNWPCGRIFLGDGGAYLLGFILAELSVQIVNSNSTVSPWFPLVLLIHPVFETLFSIYRRKFRHGLTPGQPDALHLHQLVYSRLSSKHDCRSQDAEQRSGHNSKVAPYFWSIAGTLALLDGIFWRSTDALIVTACAYCTFYVATYLRILRWSR